MLTCVFRTTRTRLLLRPGRLHCLNEYRAGRSTPHRVRSRRFNFPPSAPFPPFWEPFPPLSMKAYMTKRPGSKKGLPAWRTETEAHTTFQTRCVPTIALLFQLLLSKIYDLYCFLTSLFFPFQQLPFSFFQLLHFAVEFSHMNVEALSYASYNNQKIHSK